MTKKQFTEKFAKLEGLNPFWRDLANEIIEQEDYNQLVSLLSTKYTIIGVSRDSVESMISEELLSELKLFICDEIMGEEHSMFVLLRRKTNKIAEQRLIIEQLKKQIR